MRLRFVLVSLCALPLLSGCAAVAIGAAGAAGVAASKDQTLGQSVDDATTSNEIKAKLLRESRRRFGEVDVEVTGGLVLLSGRVDEPTDRVEAEGIAWSVSRTRDVANEIQIASAGGFLSNVSDEIITGRVRARLIGSATVKSVNINVETYDGVVYLMGIARTQEELRRAAEEASVVGGVRQVVSYIRLRGDVPQSFAPVDQKSETRAPSDVIVDDSAPVVGDPL